MSIISEVLKLSTRENVKSENSVENFPVMLKRAVCIHSSLQFVDLFMQNIMFSHGFTATPIIPNEENEISKTLSSFYRIRKEFREIFRSHHRNAVSEVAIFVGTCPVRSSYSYRVPIYICEGENSTRSSCGDTCAELNDNERRRINRDLFMHGAKDPFDKKMSNKNHRLFVSSREPRRWSTRKSRRS
ncbi:hypothetical protein GCK72_003180 [Caenorhabditis remanei]|uniref:Uncharacterized protein n=1 Tax=Caenorhabditis remanei TaxID=31234 RepID=A0A6A5HWW3_CAERE|nr:hypothetical protein GCK72_003180 [Caenorhabditis remanei]KAF1771354.1 hypothetical protein GCK72_003180 [Caenorhabditis remanei]